MTTTTTSCSWPENAPMTGYNRGCRCRRCKAAARAKQRRTTDRKRRERAEAGCQFPTHTPRSGYGRGCRCDRCVEANRSYQRNHMARKRAGLVQAHNKLVLGKNALPAEPLLEAARLRGLTNPESPMASALYEIQARGIVSERRGEELSTRMGLHPAIVWGNDYWELD